MGAGVPPGLQNQCDLEEGSGGFDSYTFPPSLGPLNGEGPFGSSRRSRDALITFTRPLPADPERALTTGTAAPRNAPGPATPTADLQGRDDPSSQAEQILASHRVPWVGLKQALVIAACDVDAAKLMGDESEVRVQPDARHRLRMWGSPVVSPAFD